MKDLSLTAIVIAKNEAKNIEACLNCLEWCDEVIVVDNNSTDDTVKIAKKWGAEIIKADTNDFAKLRNLPLKKIKTDFVMYIDADERVTPALAGEILDFITNCGTDVDLTYDVLRLRRQNICYGFPLYHGGWEDDFVERVFKLKNFIGYTGSIHESPHYRQNDARHKRIGIVDLENPLYHFTHQNTIANLYKTAAWTPVEAQLIFDGDKKKITPLIILRKGIMEFVRRFFLKKGYRDGAVGFVEALTQGLNRSLVYIQVWELQQHPTLPQRYQHEEEKIAKQWQEHKK